MTCPNYKMKAIQKLDLNKIIIISVYNYFTHLYGLIGLARLCNICPLVFRLMQSKTLNYVQ